MTKNYWYNYDSVFVESAKHIFDYLTLRNLRNNQELHLNSYECDDFIKLTPEILKTHIKRMRVWMQYYPSIAAYVQTLEEIDLNPKEEKPPIISNSMAQIIIKTDIGSNVFHTEEDALVVYERLGGRKLSYKGNVATITL